MKILIAKDKPADGDAEVEADDALDASVKAGSDSESRAATRCEACARLEFVIKDAKILLSSAQSVGLKGRVCGVCGPM